VLSHRDAVLSSTLLGDVVKLGRFRTLQRTVQRNENERTKVLLGSAAGITLDAEIWDSRGASHDVQYKVQIPARPYKFLTSLTAIW